ncbi:hypothetical protein, partial [Pseudodesulfovibrio karagichevae]
MFASLKGVRRWKAATGRLPPEIAGFSFKKGGSGKKGLFAAVRKRRKTHFPSSTCPASGVGY